MKTFDSPSHIHELKIKRESFFVLESGAKTGEVRNFSDRTFTVGDRVLLREIDSFNAYTGRQRVETISHIQRGYGLPDSLCVLSYSRAALNQPTEQSEPIALVHDFGVE